MAKNAVQMDSASTRGARAITSEKLSSVHKVKISDSSDSRVATGDGRIRLQRVEKGELVDRQRQKQGCEDAL